jgi:hypothetical protein
MQKMRGNATGFSRRQQSCSTFVPLAKPSEAPDKGAIASPSAARTPLMFLLIRFLIGVSLVAGLAYGALWVLGHLVEPEPRDIVIQVPMPRPKSG